MEKFKIAETSTADINELKTIEVACGLSPWTIQAYEEEFRRPDSVILTVESAQGVKAGFLVGRAPLDPGGQAEIYNIGALPQFRRSGVGSMLLNKFRGICDARGTAAVWLEVRVSNNTAITFYRSHGFVSTGTRTGFYTNPPEDAQLMRLSLAPRRSGQTS